jgi:hypothetical protein
LEFEVAVIPWKKAQNSSGPNFFHYSAKSRGKIDRGKF